MTELQFALSASGQLITLLFPSDLVLEALVTEDMATGEPFGVVLIDIAADGTLELHVHELELLSRECHSHTTFLRALALTVSLADNGLTCLEELVVKGL